jgi:rRNA maturation protein Nop10
VSRRALAKVDSDKPLAPMTWAQRLKRVFTIDIENCPNCGGKLRVIACTRHGFTRARATALRRYFFQQS